MSAHATPDTASLSITVDALPAKMATNKAAHETFSAPCPGSRAHVVHVINGEHFAGAERVQDLLSAGLPNFGFTTSMACVKPGEFPKRRRHQEAPLISLAMRHKFDLSAARDLARYVREHDVALLHAHTPRSAVVARMAASWTGVPLIYHVHSPTARDTTHRIRNWVNTWSERLSLWGVRKLICVSQSLARHMQQEGYAEKLLAVVPNGVPGVENLPPRSPPGARWTLGAMALFRPRKGMEILLEALAILKQMPGLPEIHLRAVGGFETESYRTELLQRAAQLGVSDLVTWTGFTSDINAELFQMDLFVLPSLFGEGMPMVVLESLAAGVPVIASAVEGVPEVIRPGIDGVLVEPANAASLADGIARVLAGQLDWRALRANCLARHAERFSATAMAQGVANVYRDVLDVERVARCSWK